MLESQLETYFRRQVRANLHGMVVQLMPTVAGIPDRLVMLPGGRMFLVELKTETGRLAPVQTEWHRKASMLGVRVSVLYGKADVDTWVSQR